MATAKDFESFLGDINPSDSTIQEASRLHKNLRTFLEGHASYSSICKDTYLSGSYAKHTFIRPKKDSDACDVDIVVETTHSVEDNPNDVLEELRDTLAERDVYSSIIVQKHSVGIDMANFHIDIVPLASKEEGVLFIGSSDDETWEQTNPKQHKTWSTEVNENFNGDYKPLVKMLKWWRREHCPEEVKYPKGIVLEKIAADNLPDEGLPIEDRLIQSMQNLAYAFDDDIADGQIPYVEDPAVEGNNLAANYELGDFAAFVDKLKEHLDLLAESGTSNDVWRNVLGTNFPAGQTTVSASLASHVKAKEQAREAAYAVRHRQNLGCSIPLKPNVTVTAEVHLPDGSIANIHSDDAPIPKGSTVIYRAFRVPLPGAVSLKWQVTNTGAEAMRVCPRGGFECPNEGKSARLETTAYTGKHFVQFFAVKGGACVQHSSPFFINVE